MKTWIRAICGALILPLSVFADPLVISSSGRGATEVAAVAAAKRQAVADALSIGFLPQEGYRIGATRVVKVTRAGTAFVANIDANLEKFQETSRVVFVVSGDDVQASRLLSLVQRVRSVLADRRTDKRPSIDVMDVRASGNLRLTRLADLQRPGLKSDLEQMAQTHRAKVIYLLTAASEPELILLAGHRTDTGVITLRTLRDRAGANIASPIEQAADAVWQDVGVTAGDPDTSTVLTLPTSNTVVRKGQSVIIYSDKTSDRLVGEESIVTYGIVTEVNGSWVRVHTEKSVAPDPDVKLRLSPQPKRGIVIKESDW